MTDLAGYQITPHLRLNDGELEQRWDNASGDDRPAQVWVAVPDADVPREPKVASSEPYSLSTSGDRYA